MTKINTQQSPIRMTLSHYFQQVKLDWFLSTPTMLLSGIGNILVFYVPPLIIANLIQRLSDDKTFVLGDAMPFVLAFAGVWILGEILWRFTFYFMIKFEARSLDRLYNFAMEEILKKDIHFFQDNFVGSLTKRVIGYAQRFIQFFDTIIFSIVCNLFPIVFASIVLWQFSPWLVIALLGTITLGIAISFPFIQRRAKLVAAREEANTVLSGHISDVIGNMNAVKAFAHESEELKVHSEYTKDYVEKSRISWNYHNERIDVIISPFYVLTNVMGLILALIIGQDSGVNVAAIFLTFSYFSNITRFFWEFNGIYRRLEESITEASLFTEYLIQEPAVTDANTKQLVVKDGAIALNNISFTHGEKTDVLFNNFSLVFPENKKTGLVGHSGAGKSTITNLLLRFMDIDGGSIEIDGQNIATVTQKSLRNNIAYVPQEPLLFHRSLRDNIAYGNPTASDKEIHQAAKKAHALEFIEALPHGFDTLVGERGVKLSGGQRQRIAIARAILKDAPILILDEATSALDSESENLIQDALKKLMKGRTSIVIAHRLSTISHLDRIVVLDNGKVVEDGTHKDLLTRNGIYAKLWSHQSGGFLED